MDDAIDLSDCGLREVVVHKLNGFRKKECFLDRIGYMEAAVVIECWPYIEAFADVEVPRFSSGGIVVDDDWAPHGTYGCGIEVEGPIIVFPG